MTRLRVSRVHHPVTALGPGRRLGVWVQGCTIACPGCVSRDTWDLDGGASIAVGDLVERAVAERVDGVTITGGEPFQQPEALHTLLSELSRALPGADLMCYSGFPWARLVRRHSPSLALLDAVVPEPYRRGEPDGGAWRGSANQPLVLLTDRARERYREPSVRSVQVSVDDSGVHMIGIPARGDLERLERALRDRGVTLQGASWT